MYNFLDIFRLEDPIHVMDIGAAVINEEPAYTELLRKGAAYLTAFDGDERQARAMIEKYGSSTTVFSDFLFDGTNQTAFLSRPEAGMSSLLKPREAALKFFNGFEFFGEVVSELSVPTRRLDDYESINPVDLLKMDVQGCELTVLQNGQNTLADCLVMQLEVPFVCLYEQQPTLGDIDCWMRGQGFIPHSFVDIKRWAISPTVFDGNFRIPGNQLLEADITYIKDPMNAEDLTPLQLQKMSILADEYLKSFDLCVFFLLELASRELITKNDVEDYLAKR